MKHLVLLLLLMPLSALSEEMPRYSASQDRMGTTYTVITYGDNLTKLQAVGNKALEETYRIDGLLSEDREDSDWSRINREAGDGPLRIANEMYHFLSTSIDYSRSSDGAFDITVGPLIKTRSFYRRSGRLPHRADIRAALAGVRYQGIMLDEEARTDRFQSSRMDIDAGGIGKDTLWIAQ